MEKQKTTVRVAGKDYALVSTDSPEHLNRVAAYVDRQMTETMRSGRIPANTAAVLTALMMPFTYSIANGLAFGFVSYALIKLLTGRAREVHAATWGVAALFVIRFAFFME